MKRILILPALLNLSTLFDFFAIFDIDKGNIFVDLSQTSILNSQYQFYQIV